VVGTKQRLNKFHINLQSPLALIFIILALIFPIILKLDPFIFSLMQVIWLYIILSQSLNMFAGYAGYVCFGQAVFFGIGAYSATVFSVNTGLSLLLTWPFGGIIAAGLAALIAYPFLRLRGLYFAIGTVTLTDVMKLIFLTLPYFGGPHGILIQTLGLVFDPRTKYYIFHVLYGILAVITTYCVYLLPRTKLGLALLAIRENEDVCGSVGIDATRVKIIGFILSVIPAGLAGGLYVAYNMFIDPFTAFSTQLSLFVLASALLGGLGTTLGPITGSIIFVLLSEELRFSLPVEYSTLHLVIFGFIVLLVVIFLRSGILGFIKSKYPHAKYLI